MAFGGSGAFVIRYHGRRYVSMGPLISPFAMRTARVTGWRSWVWTDDVELAERFQTQDKAEAFARINLSGPWEVSPLHPAESLALSAS